MEPALCGRLTADSGRGRLQGADCVGRVTVVCCCMLQILLQKHRCSCKKKKQGNWSLPGVLLCGSSVCLQADHLHQLLFPATILNLGLARSGLGLVRKGMP